MQVPRLVWTVLGDCALLGGALWRRVVRREPVHGETFRVAFTTAGTTRRDGARRALVNFAVSLTPNSYVVDIDPEGDTLLVHRLVAAPLDAILRREQQARAGPSGTPTPNERLAHCRHCPVARVGPVRRGHGAGHLVEALVGLQMAGVLETVVLMLLAEGFHRPPFFDLALVLALLTLAGGLVFARMLERWV